MAQTYTLILYLHILSMKTDIKKRKNDEEEEEVGKEEEKHQVFL